MASRRPSARLATGRSAPRRAPSHLAAPTTAHSRQDSKELTRKALLRAALKLLSRSSFDHISLREVTREAGISPTAFYRHFDDMEELGLILVEESFTSLRQMLRTARANPTLYHDVIRGSVQAVVEHVRHHEGHMRFIARERYGGVRRLRRAIRRELQLVVEELTVDLSQFPVISEWSVDDRRLFAGLVVNHMVSVASELIDATPDEVQEISELAVRQLRLTLLGVANWRSRP